MKNVVHGAAGIVHAFNIRQIGVAKINVTKNFRDVLAFPGGEIVNSTHLIALGEQRSRDGRPDKPRNTSDQVKSHEFQYTESTPRRVGAGSN